MNNQPKLKTKDRELFRQARDAHAHFELILSLENEVSSGRLLFPDGKSIKLRKGYCKHLLADRLGGPTPGRDSVQQLEKATLAKAKVYKCTPFPYLYDLI